MKHIIYHLDKIDDAVKSLVELITSGKTKTLAFKGDQIAGKTTVIKAICKQLLITSEVINPSLEVIFKYNTQDGKTVYHMDLFRLLPEHQDRVDKFNEAISNDYICLIEWPDNALSKLPEDTIYVEVKMISAKEREIIY